MVLCCFLAAVALLTSASATQAGTPYDDFNQLAARSPVVAHKVRDNVSMLEGAGGNLTVLAGPDGIFMVDVGVAASEPKVKDALRSLANDPLRYVVNTHWHWDHAEGNVWARRDGTTVIASANITKRLGQTIRVEEWGHTFAPAPAADRPNMVLPGSKTMLFSGEKVLIRPYAVGHTDGDLSVYFTSADVLATGDTFWNGMYPFIDYVAGGSIDGAIRAANRNIAMAGGNTRIVPGHGPVATRGELIAFRDMLVEARRKVAAQKMNGSTLEETIAARPLSGLDAAWGAGIVKSELFTALVYRGIVGPR